MFFQLLSVSRQQVLGLGWTGAFFARFPLLSRDARQTEMVCFGGGRDGCETFVIFFSKFCVKMRSFLLQEGLFSKKPSFFQKIGMIFCDWLGFFQFWRLISRDDSFFAAIFYKKKEPHPFVLGYGS